MARLKKLTRFRVSEYEPDSRPSMATLKKRNAAGKIAGGFIDEDGVHWVDMEVWNTTPRGHTVNAWDDPSIVSALDRI